MGVPPKNLNIEVEKALKQGIIHQSTSYFGVGGKLITFVAIETKKAKWIIEVFAEAFIAKPPTDEKSGYTYDEVNVQSGIYLSRRIGTSSIGDRYNGGFIPVVEFEKALNSGNRVLLHRYMEVLQTKIQFDDDDLERFTHIYANRSPGTDNPFIVRRLQ